MCSKPNYEPQDARYYETLEDALRRRTEETQEEESKPDETWQDLAAAGACSD